MTVDWQARDLAEMTNAILHASPYDGNGVDLVHYGYEWAQRLVMAGAGCDAVVDALGMCSAAGAAAGLVALDDHDSEHFLITDFGHSKELQILADERPLTLGDWLLAWNAAVIGRDALSTLAICSAELIMPACEFDGDSSGVWAAYCGLLAAATVNRDSLGAWIEELNSALDRADPVDLENGQNARVLPSLAIVEAINSGDDREILGALQAVFFDHAETCNAPDFVADPVQAWPPEAFALAVMLVDEGLVAYDAVAELASACPNGALALLSTKDGNVRSVAETRWADRAILDSREAHWFFDLKGIPRSSRNHVLASDEMGNLIATYTVSGALAPRGVAQFKIVDNIEAVQSTPLAIDAAELLALAEFYGAQSETAQDAVDAVDLVLARIPDGQGEVPRSSVRSAIGQAMLAESPGRFERDRIVAYRSGLASAIHDAHEDLGAKSEPDTSELVSITAASAEILTQTLQPTLQSLADETDLTTFHSLQPKQQDFLSIFVAPHADALWHAFSQLKKHELLDAMSYSAINIHACPAGMLRSENDLSFYFPGKYREISHLLRPERVWVAWQYLSDEGNSILSCDGIVWSGARWVWIPKPWRLVQ